jgi:glycosyltransferase involved in cell wall biosynthesis
MINNSFISVIIPTYKDWERLSLCLKALDIQTVSKDNFEILVINNDSNEEAPADLFIPSNCKILTEDKPGSYAARNRGVSESCGEILAFTDSDCIPSFDWIEQSNKAISNEVDIVAGKINLFYRSKDLNYAEIYEKAYAFRQELNASYGVSVTANLIVKKSVFAEIGYFDSSLLSGGDFNWTKRATNKGVKLKFFENVIVEHPSRDKLSSLILKNKRKAGGNLKKNKGDFKVVLKLIFSGFLPPFKSYVSLFGRRDLSFKEKIILIYVNYYVKIFSTMNYLSLLFGIEKAPRT